MSACPPIPNRLNALIVVSQMLLIACCIVAVGKLDWRFWPAVAIGFAIVTNSAYFSIHEAEHGALFSNRMTNHAVGFLLALFMPAPYTLMRRVHMIHHIHNRSDAESFDIYFEDEPALWKKLQFFGILTGMFWVTMVIGNVALAILPFSWMRIAMRIDRPSDTFIGSVSGRYEWQIRLEAWAVLGVHAVIMWCLGWAALRYVAMYAVFGMTWSTLQYVHHYRTTRDVLRGAKNLNYGPFFNAIWLHHGWHLTHHLHPTASWFHLPQLAGDDERPTESFVSAYLKMWCGPVLAKDRIENQYDGDVGQNR